MNDIEYKVGGIAIAVALIAYGIYANADKVLAFLGWVALTAVVIAAIWFYFWQRSQRRSEHPWDNG